MNGRFAMSKNKEVRPFNDQNNKPTDKDIRLLLQDNYRFYANLAAITKSNTHEWSFSKSGGWMEKVHDGKKALYYLIPLQGSFTISLAIREAEKDKMVDDKGFQNYLTILTEAKKYSEGYNLRFSVEDESTFAVCRNFITKLIELR
jgi:hypothetical protein